VTARRRARARIEGTVQGVGFRPYVFTLSEDLGLAGFVRNDERGVVLEVEGAAPAARTPGTRSAGRGSGGSAGPRTPRGTHRT